MENRKQSVENFLTSEVFDSLPDKPVLMEYESKLMSGKTVSYKVLERSDELIRLYCYETDEGGKREYEQLGTYERVMLDDLDGPFYVQKITESTSGSLPHGNACYIEEIDAILINPGLMHSKDCFTILAHELGHRLDYKQKLGQSGSYNEKELRAWELAVKHWGGKPWFNHLLANADIKEAQEGIDRDVSDK